MNAVPGLIRANYKVGLFVILALLMQGAFVASYIGAMHGPVRPRKLPVVVAGPDQAVHQVAEAAGTVLDVTGVPSRAAAERAIRDRSAFAAFLPSLTGTADTLLVTTAESPTAATYLTTWFTAMDRAAHRTLTTRDLVPTRSGDAEGLVPFYLVIAWTVGGYLVSTLTGIMAGMTSATAGKALLRIAVLAGYSVLGGMLGTLIVRGGYQYLGGNWLAMAGLGSAIVFAVSLVGNGLQSLLGLFGTGLTIIVFVVLGNPSAGGPWPVQMVPAFWRVIGPWLPNWQGTWAVRGIAYFSGHGLAVAFGVLAAWAVAGLALSLGLAGRSNPLLRLGEHG